MYLTENSFNIILYKHFTVLNIYLYLSRNIPQSKLLFS